MNGIIMELETQHIIVLTKDGEFYRVKKEKKHEKGMEIKFMPEQKKKIIKSSKWKKQTSILSAAAIVITAIIFVLPTKAQAAYAYVSIDINPSVEFSVNRQWDIIHTTFANQDGKKLLKSLPKVKGDTVTKAFEEIIAQAKKEGKLKNGGDVWVTGVLSSSKKSSNIEKNKINQIKNTLDETDKVQIITEMTTEKERLIAEKLNVSPGKYLYYKKMKKMGNPIKLKNVKNDSVTQLQIMLNKSANKKNKKKVTIRKYKKSKVKNIKKIVKKNNMTKKTN